MQVVLLIALSVVASAPESVTINNIAPLSVSRDWLDYATWGGSVLLLLVGVVGVVLANRTLRAIEIQAKEMSRQNQNQISKERAKLRVELERFSGEPYDPIGFVVNAKVSIFGVTEAIIEKTAFVAQIVKADQSKWGADWFPEMPGVPKVIPPGSNPINTHTFLQRPVSVLAGDEGIGDVLSGASIVYCTGEIHYTDVFNGRWVFRFSKRHKFHFRSDGEILVGYWEDCGQQEENGEYPVKTTSPENCARHSS